MPLACTGHVLVSGCVHPTSTPRGRVQPSRCGIALSCLVFFYGNAFGTLHPVTLPHGTVSEASFTGTKKRHARSLRVSRESPHMSLLGWSKHWLAVCCQCEQFDDSLMFFGDIGTQLHPRHVGFRQLLRQLQRPSTHFGREEPRRGWKRRAIGSEILDCMMNSRFHFPSSGKAKQNHWTPQLWTLRPLEGIVRP